MVEAGTVVQHITAVEPRLTLAQRPDIYSHALIPLQFSQTATKREKQRHRCNAAMHTTYKLQYGARYTTTTPTTTQKQRQRHLNKTE